MLSQRGARGGYRLAQSLASISVSDVIAAIDGPIALTACVEGSGTDCEVQGMCAVRGRWEVVNDAIRGALGAISLAELRAASIPPAFRVPAHHTAPAE